MKDILGLNNIDLNQYVNSFTNFTEIALWTYKVDDDFYRGQDISLFLNAIYNSKLVFTNDYYLRFKKMKSLEECIMKTYQELGVFPKIKIDKFLSEIYFNDFNIKNYVFEDIINGEELCIESDLTCLFNEENKLILIMGSFIDRTSECKNRKELENLNKILIEQNNYFSRTIKELENEKAKSDLEQELYKGLFFDSPSPKLIINSSNFNILQINNAALTLFEAVFFENMQLLDLVDSTNYEELAEYFKNHNGRQTTLFKGFAKSTKNELYLDIKSVRIKYNGSTAILVHITDLFEQIKYYEKEYKLKEKISVIQNTLIDTQTSYKNFIDESPFAVIIVQNESIKYINKVCMEVLGAKSENELIDKNIYNFIDSTYHQFVEERFNKVLNDRLHTESLKEKLIRLNGEKFLSEIITFPTQYDGKDAVQILFTDITEKVYHQQLLLESEEQYRSIFENSFDSIFITDFSGNITDCNSVAVELMRTNYTKLVNSNINQVLITDTYSFIENPFEKILNENKFEGRCFAKDFEGRDFIVGVSFSRIKLLNQERICISVKDISTEIISINKLNESRKEATDIIDNLTIPVSISDFETGEVFYYSQKFKEVFGNQINKYDFRTFQLYKSESDAKYLRSLLEENKRIKNYETVLIDKDGTEFFALISSTRIKFREKDSILSIIIDISQRKKYELEISHKDRILEEMSVVSKTGGWEYDLSNQSLVWTNETYKIHNVEQGTEISSEYGISFFHPDDHKLINECFNNLAEKSESFDIEVRLKPKEREYIWVRIIGHVVTSDNDKYRLFGTIQDINQNKIRDIKLKEYGETITLAAKAANFGIFDWNLLNNKLVWDDNMWKLFELPRIEIEDVRFWQKKVIKEDKQRVRNELLKALKKKKSFEFEFRLKTTNNSIKHIKTYAYIDFTKAKTKRIVGICWDITKDKIQEEKLADSLKKYESLYNNSPVMLHSIDREGKILSVSDFWLRKMGYDRKEVIGVKSIKFLTEKSKKYAEEVVLPNFYKNGYINSVHYEFIKKNKEIINVEMNASSENDSEGNYVRSLAVMFDITDKLKVEKESELKTNRLIEFRKALDASAYVVFTNESGNIKYANNNFQELVEISASKLHNKMFCRLISETECDFDSEKFYKTISEGNIWQGELKLSNNAESWVKLTAIPLFDSITGNKEILIILFDITRIVEAEKNLQSLNKSLEDRVKERTKDLINLNKDKDNILSMVSHDLKNPITGIILATDILNLQAEKYKDDKLKEIADKISKTSYKMIEIIKNLLELNAVESGKIQTSFTYVDLTLLLENIVNDIKINASNKQQEIIILNNYDQYPVYIDKKLLSQILDNLLSNAIKFTKKGKNIWVELIDEESYYSIKIKDEGIGIKEEELEFIFQKFVKLSSKPTDGEDSTGLGLSIVKQLVELMNGTINVESKVNIGTTFIIRFNRHQTNF